MPGSSENPGNGPRLRIAPLDDLVAVGAVFPEAARIWIRSRRQGPLSVRCSPQAGGSGPAQTAELTPENGALTDFTASVLVAGLVPSTRYRVEVRDANDETLGRGAFVTAPARPEDAPDHFSIALTSCNLPFDPEGKVSPQATAMLAAADRCLARHDPRYVLWMGDQMYADMPSALSLYDEGYFRTVGPPGRARLNDCTPEEVRRVFQERYRRFWSVPGILPLHSELPGYPIWDDHEVIDNWNSHPWHREAEWRSIAQGAREAYFDYQGSRVIDRTNRLPESFDYHVDYGDVSTLVLDLRSCRTGGEDGRIMSKAQFERFQTFLEERSEQSVLLIVLSVPPVHLPRMVADIGARIFRFNEDFSDRWSSLGHRQDRNRLLTALREHAARHPHQRIAILGGDIHVGCAHRLHWEDDGPSVYQFVSSALTNRASRLARWASGMGIEFNRKVDDGNGGVARVERVPAEEGTNPYSDLNFGVLEFRRGREAGTREMRFSLYGESDGQAVVGYRSPWLP